MAVRECKIPPAFALLAIALSLVACGGVAVDSQIGVPTDAGYTTKAGPGLQAGDAGTGVDAGVPGCNPGTHVAANGGCDPDTVTPTSTETEYCLDRDGDSKVDCSACITRASDPGTPYKAKAGASCDDNDQPVDAGALAAYCKIGDCTQCSLYSSQPDGYGPALEVCGGNDAGAADAGADLLACNPGTHRAPNGGCDPDATSAADAGTTTALPTFTFTSVTVEAVDGAGQPAEDHRTITAHFSVPAVQVDLTITEKVSQRLVYSSEVASTGSGTTATFPGAVILQANTAYRATITANPGVEVSGDQSALWTGEFTTSNFGTVSVCPGNATACVVDRSGDGKAETFCAAATLFQNTTAQTVPAALLGNGGGFSWSVAAGNSVAPADGYFCADWRGKPAGYASFTLVSTLKANGQSAVGTSGPYVWMQNLVFCTSGTANSQSFCADQGGGNFLFAVDWDGTTLTPAGDQAP